MNIKDKKIVFVIFLILLAIAVISVLVIYFPMKNKVKAPISSGDSTLESQSNSNSSTQFDAKSEVNDPNQNISKPASSNSAENYYNEGLKDIANKDYSEAIFNFSKAIELDPKQENYYSKKAEAQVLAGDKNGAIATVQTGLKALPDDQLLLNKLDIINATVK
ncbi:MAG: tetratricopeptide repeat protein [Patescibacteria group bacterium]